MGSRRKAANAVFQEQQANLQVAAAGVRPPSLQRKRSAPSPQSPPPPENLKSSEELQLEKEPIQVRVTGFWRWKRVIVPPNAYVVHTRIGRAEPVTLGLGVSFRYNPYTDAYLVVPAAMQTIGVVANCISQEKQGINVLAYVQWQISDFAIAYRRLDFSDSRDPLSIVNAQLREQAEAAIKDKIATMSVEEVLTDKAPVIEELTRRLIAVTEGRGGENDEGLGIKIVTVQIKEALVSSQRLWEHLQAPFRNEKEKTARISQLTMQDEIRGKELENRHLAETSQAETEVEITRIKERTTTESQQSRLEEEAKRAAREHEAHLETLRRRVEANMQEMTEETRLAEAHLQAEQQRIQRETTLRQVEHTAALQIQQQRQENLQAEQQVQTLQLTLEDTAHQAQATQAERDAQIARLQQEIRNLINDRDLTRRLINKLPEIMPQIDELRVLQMDDPGSALVKNLLTLLEALKLNARQSEE